MKEQLGKVQSVLGRVRGPIPHVLQCRGLERFWPSRLSVRNEPRCGSHFRRHASALRRVDSATPYGNDLRPQTVAARSNRAQPRLQLHPNAAADLRRRRHLSPSHPWVRQAARRISLYSAMDGRARLPTPSTTPPLSASLRWAISSGSAPTSPCVEIDLRHLRSRASTPDRPCLETP
jgi:hypothetical protein